jgi:signal transduction histidine kinase
VRPADIATLAVVVTGFVSMVASAATMQPYTPGELGLLAGLCGLYLWLGVYGWALCERMCSSPLTLGYFGAQFALALLIGVVGRGSGGFWILMFPLAGQSTTLTWPWTLGVCAAILAAFAGQVGLVTGDWALAAQSTVTFLAGLVFVVVVTKLAVRESVARAEVERLAVELRAYAAQAEELATARERNRLAREIHDTLGHYLTIINIQLEAARTVLDTDRPRVLEALGTAQSLARDGLSEVRRSVAALRASPVENRPLSEAIARLVDEARAAGIPTELALTGEPRQLAPQAELALYRAAQEGLTNVRKHAGGGAHAVLSLAYGPDGNVRLTVSDNGSGVDTVGANGQVGFGLLGVRERVALLGGQMAVRSAPGEGFTLEVLVPA